MRAANALSSAFDRLNRAEAPLWQRNVRRLRSFLSRLLKSSSPPGGSERPRSGVLIRPGTLLLTVLIILEAAIATTAGVLVKDLREAALTHADRIHRNLALVLADHTERAFEAVELVQTAILQQFLGSGLRTPDQFRERLSGSVVHDDLQRRSALLPQIDAFAISDSIGDVINYSRSTPMPFPPINVADRDFYRGLKDHPERTIFVSEPVQARSNGKWTVYIGRRISEPEGGFLGILQAALELDYFTRLYQAVLPAGEAAITLFRQDGRSLLRYPPFAAGKGAPYARVGPLRTDARPGYPVAVARLIRNIDGQDRLIADTP